MLCLCAVMCAAVLNAPASGQRQNNAQTITEKSYKPELVIQTGHTGAVLPVAFSPDGKILASGSTDYKIILWNTESGRQIRTLEGHDHVVESVAFSPGGKTLASGSRNNGNINKIKLWNVETGQEIKSLEGHSSSVNAVIFSRDGKNLVSGSDDSTIKIWNIESGQPIKSLEGHIGPVESVVFSPDGKSLFSAGEDKTIKIWDVESGQFIKSLEGHKREVESVAISRDGKTLASGSFPNDIRLWNVETGQQTKSLEDRSGPDNAISFTTVSGLAFSRDGKTLASGSERDTINIWNIESGRLIKSLEGHTGSINSVAFSPDGKTIASGSEDKTIKIWDIESGQLTRLLGSHTFEVQHTAFSPDKKTLASITNYRTIKLWNNETGQFIKSLEGHHTDSINSVAFFPDGKTLVSGSSDKTIKIWNVKTGLPIKTLGGVTYEVDSIALSSDGKLLASASKNFNDTTIKIWNLESGQQIKSLEGHTNIIQFITFSPEGKTLASISWDMTIKVWNVETGEMIKSFKGHRNLIHSIAFSPDGKTLASASWDETIKLWNVESGQLIDTLEGHASFVTAIAFSPDGRTLVSGGADSTIKLWNVEKRQLIKSIEGETEAIKSITFSSDGHFLISGSSDAIMKIWDRESNKPLVRLISLDEKDWVVVTSDGRFDTSKNLDDIEGLHWLLPDEPLTPKPLDIFMRQYYEPSLLKRVLKCSRENNCDKEFKPLPSIADINRVQPKVEIIGSPKPVANEPGVIEVTVEVENARGSQRQNDRPIELESGVYDLRLFRDGQLVGYEPVQQGGSVERASNPNKGLTDDEEQAQWRRETEVKLDKGGRATRTFKVRLPRGTEAKQVELSAYAFNADRVRSKRSVKTVENPVAFVPVKRRAYIIAVGVNANENEAWDLSFAANDARRIERNMREQLVRAGQYALDDIVTVSLISDYAKGADGQKVLPRRMTESYATKRNFQTVLELLAGKNVDPALVRQLPDYERLQSRLRQARPEDLVLISFSSHGYADPQGNFYLVPYDMGTSGGADLAAQDVLRRSISSADLSRWLRDVDAGELTMIVDACHAALSVQTAGFKPGPMASRGLGQLAYDKGMRILTSTQAGDKAWEADELSDVSNAGGTSRKGDDQSSGGGNGLLTYVLTRDGLETFKADANHDGSVTLSEWLTYGVEGVPVLAQALQKRIDDLNAANLKSIPLGSGTAARVIILNRNDNSASTTSELQQLPSLFDFARKRRDPVIAVGNYL